MIQDLNDTLKELLVQKIPVDLSVIDVKFETPTKEWATGVSKPTINLFLYDVRENHELRDNQRYVTRRGAVATQRRAPVRLDMTYLVTVWTADVSDEHKLLGRLITSLLGYPQLPGEVLKGAMQNQPLPLHAWIAQPDRTPNVWDFWGGLDGPLKVGISYVVTTSVEPYPAEEIGLVTEKVLKLKEGL